MRISIGGVSITCIQPSIIGHPKYHGKRLWYVLIKELMRRVNLHNINHFVLNFVDPSVAKPLSTIHIWIYDFDHPANTQLPSAPRTPGWRRITSEDVPSALALINKWSSQFEIRQVFNSEEFSHIFLCPTLPNTVFTYVVENGTNITDLVSLRFINVNVVINAVVSTQTPVKQLLINALVCAKKSGGKILQIFQRDIKPNVLLSLSFRCKPNGINCLIYNYKYHEVTDSQLWYIDS